LSDLSPESHHNIAKHGRSSDSFSAKRLPIFLRQWHFCFTVTDILISTKLTATGIVPDLHRIPY